MQIVPSSRSRALSYVRKQIRSTRRTACKTAWSRSPGNRHSMASLAAMLRTCRHVPVLRCDRKTSGHQFRSPALGINAAREQNDRTIPQPCYGQRRGRVSKLKWSYGDGNLAIRRSLDGKIHFFGSFCVADDHGYRATARERPLILTR